MTRIWMVEEFGRGGIARYAVDVANLLEPSHDVVVATTSAGPAPGLEPPRRSVVWFPTGEGRPIDKVRAAVRGVVCAAREPRPGDVVWLPLGVRPAFELTLHRAARTSGARVFVTIHNRVPHRSGASTSRFVVTAALGAERAIVHTEDMHRWASSHGIDPIVVPFPPPRLPAAPGILTREALGLGDSDIAVLLFGNLHPYRGADVLVDALAIATARRPAHRVHLLIAGLQRTEVDAMDQAAALGIAGRVRRFPGYIDDAELADLLQIADVIALPYRKVDHSAAGALARSTGKPVVASDLPGLRELFGERADYRPLEDAKQWARALLELPDLVDGGPSPEAGPPGGLAEAYAFLIESAGSAGDMSDS